MLAIPLSGSEWGRARLDASLEIRLVEFEPEPPYSWVDLHLSAPRHSWQRAGCGAGRARHQAVLSRSEGKPHAGGRRQEGQRGRALRIRVLVQIDNDRPRRPVDQGAYGDGLVSGRIRCRTRRRRRYDGYPRWGRTARITLIGLANLLLLDGHLGEAQGGYPQEEAAEVLAVAVRDRIAW